MKHFIILTIIVYTGIMIQACNQSSIKSVTIVSKEDPTISVRFLFNVGSQNDPAGKEGLASITAEMLADASTRVNSYNEILDKLYPLAASYSAQVDKEQTVIIGRTHKDNWEAYYQLIKEAILQPAFKEEDFNRIKSQTLNYLENTLRYSNDEELGKQALNRFIFKGTPYGHPEAGLIASVKNLTIDDVKEFYRQFYTQKNLIIGLGGDVDKNMLQQIRRDMQTLPVAGPPTPPIPEPEPIDGLEVLLIEKNTNSTAISLGFPIDLERGDPDFMAMWLANSWFGEHRNSSSHLFQVIREARGLNYGDYSYIEAFPNGDARIFPPQNVARRKQIFQIWIRPVQNRARHFALRAAMRELQKLVDNGLTEEQFELTKKFLSKYYLHYAPTTMKKLGYRLDDYFYGLKKPFLDTFEQQLDALTLEQVNGAIKKHLQYKNIKIVMVTQGAETLKRDLVENRPSPMKYTSPKPQSVLNEDKEIETYPLDIKAEKVKISKIEDMFVE